MKRAETMDTMEKKRAKRRKQTAEVFTPPWLINDMLDRLEEASPVTFTDPTKTFCDPACGNGNMLIEVLKRKLANGQHPTTALGTIYGVELMGDNVNECRTRLLSIVGDNAKHRQIVQKHIVNADGLEYDFSFE